MSEDEAYARAIGRIDAAPALNSFLGSSSRPILVFEPATGALLARSPAAAAIAGSETLAAQARAIAARPPAPGAMRLERLRLDAGRLAPPTIGTCLLAPTQDGGSLLLVALPDSPAAGSPRAATPPPAATESPVAESAPAPSTARFTWASDADGRITRASPPLARIVGAEVSGASWFDLVGRRLADAEGRLAAALRAGSTFRALPVVWRVGEGEDGVAGSLSGTPATGSDPRTAGFGGFGLLEPDRRVPMPPPAIEDEPPAPPARPEPSPAPVPVGAPAAPEPTMDVPTGFAAFAGATMAEFVDIVAAPLAQFGLSFALGTPRPGTSGTPVSRDDPAPSSGDRTPEAAPPSAPPQTVPDERDAALTRSTPEASPPSDPLDAPAPSAETAPPIEPTAIAPPPRDDTVLSFNEHAAFREIAQALAGRFGQHADGSPQEDGAPAQAGYGEVTPFPIHAVARRPSTEPVAEDPVQRLLDRLPIGVLVHRGDDLLHANRQVLDLVGFDDVATLEAEGGLPGIFQGLAVPGGPGGEPAAIGLLTRDGRTVSAEARLSLLDWQGAPATLILLRRLPEGDPAQSLAATELTLQRREARLREANAILDAVPDGVVTVDAEDRVVGCNRGAQRLFGHDPREVVGEPVAFLFAPQDRARALTFLHAVREAGGQAGPDLDLTGRGPRGADIPLALSAAPLAADEPGRLGLVLRDVSAFRAAEAELLRARRAAEAAIAQRTDLLTGIGQEIRTPLDTIVSRARAMLEERRGTAGTERDCEALSAIQASGARVSGLVGDLVDLVRLEAGRAELAFTGVALNDLVARCVATMQPEAARERIVMRTSFAPNLPAVLADEAAMRRAALTVIADAIRVTDPGGQVIVSTALSERGEVALRVRDTGHGTADADGSSSPSERRAVDGLGLPLIKALVEANRGALHVSGGSQAGTLVEVVFPPGRVLAG